MPLKVGHAPAFDRACDDATRLPGHPAPPPERRHDHPGHGRLITTVVHPNASAFALQVLPILVARATKSLGLEFVAVEHRDHVGETLIGG